MSLGSQQNHVDDLATGLHISFKTEKKDSRLPAMAATICHVLFQTYDCCLKLLQDIVIFNEISKAFCMNPCIKKSCIFLGTKRLFFVVILLTMEIHLVSMVCLLDSN